MMDFQQVKFSPEELARYNRHIIIPEFGLESQQKLKAARVLVVGTGGLGSPALLYLAAAGVGTLGIVDFDVVEDSNLHRQVLFTREDINRPKVEVAIERLKALNPHIEYIPFNTQINSTNAREIVQDFDVVADGTDNFPTRYLINDVCYFTGKTNVYASIFQFEGQVSVFNHTFPNGEIGPNYRDVFAAPPPAGLVPSCAEGGVLGVLPGIIGSMQALEVIKVITGAGEPLAGRMFVFDTLKFETRILRVNKDPDNPISGQHPTITQLIDYEEFCGIRPAAESSGGNVVKEKTVQDLVRMRQEGTPFQLIDVREPYEYEIANL